MRIGAFEFQEPIPAFEEAHVIAMLYPWLDAGSVGTLTLRRLERYFGSQELGRLEKPGNFFDFTRYRPTTRFRNGQRVQRVPNTRVSKLEGRNDPPLIVMQVREPHANAEDYIASIIEVLKTFNVTRYTRIGAMYDATPHTRPLQVTGTLNGEPMTGLRGLVSRRRSNYEGPTSIMNTMSQELTKYGIEDVSLMVRLPQYAQLERDYAGTARLLEILSTIYNLPGDLPDTEAGKKQYEELDSEITGNPAAQELVKRLESYYDSRHSGSSDETSSDEPEESDLPADIQTFLSDMSQRLDNPN
ncbi:MAG: PAC2 family protein [Chloroflexi bacterium]|nr:PAC2 family protein [Chloroflexota bacterium]